MAVPPRPAGAPAIRVLVVDDSALIRQILSRSLAARGYHVVGAASNPYQARDLILKLRPDVLTLDLEMPKLDGLTFLDRLMAHYPLPVVVLSSLTPEKSPLALEALRLGAIEVIGKPGAGISESLENDVLPSLCAALELSARARPRRRPDPPLLSRPRRVLQRTSDKAVVIGASTGGTEALSELLSALPPDSPGLVVVQHMPPAFTASFAERLNRECAIEVREARDGDLLQEGLALIAPGNQHALLQRSGARYQVLCQQGPLVHHMRPSVDVLFHSAAREVGPNLVGVLLTGMGRDGAEGLKAILDAGGATLAQNEETCVVFGMPKEAIRLGAVQRVLKLEDIAGEIMRQVLRLKRRIP